ncbi:hypothetical protein [Fluviicola sp.]|uniref:hypothetical protein n=1 Tax=Fluviicola sp. TaxID=1917219 RepID=UPI0031D89FCF
MKAMNSLNVRIRYVILSVFGMVSAISNAQLLNSQRNWAMNKHELSLGLGATGFLGDLGGADQIVSDYSLKHIDLNSTHFGGSFSYRYRFHPFFATSTMVNAGMLRGSDAYTEEAARNMRNLSFRSFFVMLSQRIEFIILSSERLGYRKRSGRFADRNGQLYLIGGIGAMYFNPKAPYQGGWTSLHDKHTEGQGLSGGPAEYKRITASIPMGIGFRVGISRLWRIGMEATYVKTFSDYIDDVSGSYYDPAMIGAVYGPNAAYLSNPSQTPEAYNPGSQRGGKQKDAFFYVNVVLTRNITYKSRITKF